MRKWIPLITVCLGSFMLLVDVTVVNVALPRMAVDLRASFTSLQWVIDIYAIALAALLLGAGALSDRIGHRRVYVGGLALFALSSLTAGLAPDTALLIAARGSQGVGAAAMFATTIALINGSYTGRDRGIAFGAWGAVNGAAAAAGPIVGGLLTQALSWRWIFFINLPISVVAVALSLRALPRERGTAGPRLDLFGVATFTVAAAALTYALTRAPEIGWTAAATVALLGVAAAALVAFVVTQLRVANPLLELELLRSPAFLGVLLVALMLSAAAFGCMPFLSLWLQSIRDMTPIQAGLALLPLSLAALVSALLIGRVLHSSSPRLLIGGGMALIGVGGLLEAHLHGNSSWSAVTLGLVVAGVGVGLVTPTLTSTALAAVSRERGGMAAGAVNTLRQLGYALGIAVLGAVSQSEIARTLSSKGVDGSGSLATGLAGGQAQAILDPAPAAARPHLDATIHAAFAAGLNRALLVGAAVGLAGAVLAVLTVRTREERVQARGKNGLGAERMPSEQQVRPAQEATHASMSIVRESRQWRPPGVHNTTTDWSRPDPSQLLPPCVHNSPAGREHPWRVMQRHAGPRGPRPSLSIRPMDLCLMIEGQEGVSWEQWLALARSCEEHSIPTLFRSDHYMNLDGQHPQRGSLDAWGTLSALAAVTSTLRLGTLVSPATFRHPSNLAKLVASADRISEGRIELGLGAGWHQREHDAYGFEFPSTRTRMDVLEEQLQIIVGSWTQAPFSFNGKHYALKDLDAQPKPVQRPHPPLIMGGSAGPRSVALAARFADEYNSAFPSLADVKTRRQRIEAACERARRDPIPFSVMTGYVVGSDRSEYEDRVRRLSERTGGDADRFLADPPEAWITGTADDAAEQLQALKDAGVSRVMCQNLLHDDLDVVALIGSELAPQLV